jgi:hypothetical protein
MCSQTGLKEIRIELCCATTATSRSRARVPCPRTVWPPGPSRCPSLTGRASRAARLEAAPPEVPRPEPPWRSVRACRPHTSRYAGPLSCRPPATVQSTARARSIPPRPLLLHDVANVSYKRQAVPRAWKPEPPSPRAAPPCLDNRHCRAPPPACSRSRVTPVALSLVPSGAQAAAL